MSELKKFEIVVSAKHVEGTQTFACVASCRLDAVMKFKRGEADIIDEELDVTDHGEDLEVSEVKDISSRLPNDVLNQEIDELKSEKEELVKHLKEFMEIVKSSDGVAGYHLNGDIAEWDEFDEVFAASELLDSID